MLWLKRFLVRPLPSPREPRRRERPRRPRGRLPGLDRLLSRADASPRAIFLRSSP